jgi:hypothetical protein
MARGWIVQQWLPIHCSVSAVQSENLEALEQDGPMVQPQSKTESLEAPWRVTSVCVLKR